MSLFNLTTTTGLKDSGNFLKSGIHKAKFVSLELGKIAAKDGSKDYAVMSLKLDVENYGEWTHNFFEPTSGERTSSQFGVNPSQAEQFMVSLRQIFDALDPAIGEMIDNKDVQINGKKINLDGLDFDQLIKLANYLTKPCVGKEVEIKLIPRSDGFNDFPGFPARVNKLGILGIATRFIGHNLTISQSEQKKIDSAINARPTTMPNEDASLDGLTDLLDDEKGDLPF